MSCQRPLNSRDFRYPDWMQQRPDITVLSKVLSTAHSPAHARAIAQYRVPAVRHLAWMCRAPQLVGSPVAFDLSEHLPENLEETLGAWDAAPEAGPLLLTETPPRRLGHYFENLYACLLRDLLGWEILLRNQPIRSNGITLGELDFIVRNPVNQAIEHHEIAVKFYLGHPSGHPSGHPGTNQVGPLWYGPNASDRLDLKSERLVSHQSRLTERPETRDLLRSLNIPTPARARVFMPGYLFYPASQRIPSPIDVPPNHLRGEWLYIDDLDRMNHSGTLTEALSGQWVPLVKPHWLGPWRQEDPPGKHAAEEALEMVRSAGIPRLFSVLGEVPEQGLWREHNRVFVVPGIWPNPRP